MASKESPKGKACRAPAAGPTLSSGLMLIFGIPVWLVLGAALQAEAAPVEPPNGAMELLRQPVGRASARDGLEPAQDGSFVLAQAGQMSPMEWSTDRPGLDYTSFEQPVDDPAYCGNACARDPQCMAWTYVRPYTIQGPYPRCWLKYAIPQPQPNPCCVSGTKLTRQPRRESGMGPMEWDTNRAGADYHSFNLPNDNPGLCQDECQRDQRCRAWTYVRPGVQGPWPRCWLKGAVPPARRDPCCVSGTKLD